MRARSGRLSGATSKWRDRLGLDVALEVLRRGPASRHRAAVEAWALAHDWVVGVSGDRLVADDARLREAGVQCDPGRSIEERFAAAGVNTE